MFGFVESLLWFAQAHRSGVWTYYNATPGSRQNVMLRALESDAPDEFATYYALGMRDWQDALRIKVVDGWMQDHEEVNNRWLWRLVSEHRPMIKRSVHKIMFESGC